MGGGGNNQKDRTLKQTKNPFDDLDKAEFKMRFRLAKITDKKLLE